MSRSILCGLLALACAVAVVPPALAGENAGSTAGPPPTRAESEASHFGIQAGLYDVEAGRVPRAATFADLLDDYGVNYRTALALLKAAPPDFEAEDLRTGKPYRVYWNPWLQKAQYVVYQMSPVKHVVFDVQRPRRTHLATRPVQRQWATVGGTVESSLYETLVSNGGHPVLALRLSEVFAWQMDFFRIRPQDRFRIVYEQRSAGGTQLQPGAIVAAYVEHLGEEYYAFRFDTGSGAEYYNRQGQSLQRKLLKAPLQYSRISSGFTNRRYHPVLKEYRPHRGVDYAAPRGTPVRAVGDGEVLYAGYKGANGNYVKIQHNSTYMSGYLHLSEIAVAPGQAVDQGETIGYVGSTGRSTGPHLDYRLWKHGTPVNPRTVDLPPSRPVPLQYREGFRRTVQALLPWLRRPSVFAGVRAQSVRRQS